jgi:chaperonin GroES
VDRIIKKPSHEEAVSIKPLFDKVLVRLAEVPGSVGRIILPDNAKDKPMKGTVLAVGPDVDCGEEDPEELLVGRTVIFNYYSPTAVPGSKDLVFIKEADLLGVED